MSERETYSIVMAGVHRDLPKFEVSPGLRIALLNILGDTELVQACAEALIERTRDINYDAIMTAETKSIPLAYEFSIRSHKPYIVLRKSYKFYMGKVIKAETLSITTGEPQILYLDEKDQEMINGKRVLIVDDVVSTGSTLDGMRSIAAQAGAEIAAEVAILTEGDEEQWANIISLGHLPLFRD
jgi:adenine phosphoribosyltransferase